MEYVMIVIGAATVGKIFMDLIMRVDGTYKKSDPQNRANSSRDHVVKN